MRSSLLVITLLMSNAATANPTAKPFCSIGENPANPHYLLISRSPAAHIKNLKDAVEACGATAHYNAYPEHDSATISVDTPKDRACLDKALDATIGMSSKEPCKKQTDL